MPSLTRPPIPALALALLIAGCGTNEYDAGPEAAAVSTTEVDASGALGDGTLASVKLTVLYTPGSPQSATDLDFNPQRPGELWVTFRHFHDGAPCDEPLPGTDRATSCDGLEGWVVILADARTHTPKATPRKDPNAWHFMRLPSGIAFAEDETFATVSEARTGNYDDDPLDFNGPVLWSSDPAVFAVEIPGQNGSHLDMLHASAFAMGVAHEKGNVYWVMNGQAGALDRYDFRQPHEIGGEDHSDGQAWRFLEGEIARVPGVPSGLAFDARDGSLYVADTGHARVLRVDTASGSDGDALPTDDGQMPTIQEVRGATVTEVVPPGALEQPSGVARAGDLLFVTDSATSRVHAFTLDGTEVVALDTGLPSGTLGGVAVGPDGRVYLADLVGGSVRRIDPGPGTGR